MRIAVIAPHPDDETLGCGGTILRHADAGDEVHVVLVTRGSPDVFAPELVETIRTEMRAAHEVLGVHRAHDLEFPAPKLDVVPAHELADRLRETLAGIRPEVVYVPHWGDLHVDHRAVFDAALVATRPLGAHRPGRVLCYETLSETEWAGPLAAAAFTPNVFTDISGFLNRKLEAMACYRSQLYDAGHPRSLDTVELLARLRGSTAGVKAAEAFVLIREIA